MQHFRYKKNAIRNYTVMRNGLFFALPVNNRITGCLTAGSGGCRNGSQWYFGIKIFLLQKWNIFWHAAEEFDTFCCIHGTAAADCNNSIAAFPLEKFHPFTDILIGRIGVEIRKADVVRDNGIYYWFYRQRVIRFPGDQQNFSATEICQEIIQMFNAPVAATRTLLKLLFFIFL